MIRGDVSQVEHEVVEPPVAVQEPCRDVVRLPGRQPGHHALGIGNVVGPRVAVAPRPARRPGAGRSRSSAQVRVSPPASTSTECSSARVSKTVSPSARAPSTVEHEPVGEVAAEDHAVQPLHDVELAADHRLVRAVPEDLGTTGNTGREPPLDPHSRPMSWAVAALRPAAGRRRTSSRSGTPAGTSGWTLPPRTAGPPAAQPGQLRDSRAASACTAATSNASSARTSAGLDGSPGRRPLGRRAHAARAARRRAGAPRRDRRRSAGCAGPPTSSRAGCRRLTPAPPKIWIARSTTASATRGATTLIAAISLRAPLAPTVSIIQAALSVSSRACSISIRDVGDPLLHDALAGQRPAEGLPLGGPVDHQLQRPLGHADRRACSGGSGPGRGGPGRWRSRRPPRPAGCDTGTRTSVKVISA